MIAATAHPENPPAGRAEPKTVSKLPPDAMIEAIDALRTALKPRLVAGLSIVRDNPGKTPQQWSVKDAEGRTLLSFGLIDRTFFWTWDEGVSNHYAKSREVMTRVITGELARFGHLV